MPICDSAGLIRSTLQVLQGSINFSQIQSNAGLGQVELKSVLNRFDRESLSAIEPVYSEKLFQTRFTDFPLFPFSLFFFVNTLI